MKHSHRLQTIGVLLLAIFGWLAFDAGSVKDRVWSYLDPTVEADEIDTTRTAEASPRAPTLIGHPQACPPRPAPAAGGGGGRTGVRRPTTISGDRDTEQTLTSIWLNPSSKRRVRDFAALVRVLNLDPRQQDELRRVLADAARELDDLRHLPTEEGLTWHGVIGDVRGTGWGAHRALMIALGDFVDTPLRGGWGTYREQQQRIIDRYTAVVRDRLDPEQQLDFDTYDVTRVIDPDGRHHVYTLKALAALKKKLVTMEAGVRL